MKAKRKQINPGNKMPVGFPMIEGLMIANNMLIGAGLRDDVKIICSGR